MVTTPSDQQLTSGSPSPPAAALHQAVSPTALTHLLKQQPFPPLTPELAAAAAAAAAANAAGDPLGAVQRLAAALAASRQSSGGAARGHQQDQRTSSSSNNNNSSSSPSPTPGEDMKVPPISLPGSAINGGFSAAAAAAAGLPLPPELLWRLPTPMMPPSPSPHLPSGLTADPRTWTREDVAVFVRHCEREFDLEKIDMDKFQMNGKALCLLNKQDLSERCSGAGDVIHNILQSLVNHSNLLGFTPSSPLTPRAPGLITPTSPAFPQSHPWPMLVNSLNAASSTTGEVVASAATSRSAEVHSTSSPAVGPPAFPGLNHLTLSPSSGDSGRNGTSPKQPSASDHITSIHQLYPAPQHLAAAAAAANAHAVQAAATASKLHVPPPLNGSSNGGPKSNNSGSTHSDSEDSQQDGAMGGLNVPQPPRTPTSSMPPQPRSPKDTTPSSSSPSGKEGETPELNTNGRLLWDFLQQLLNNPQQQYSAYIAWKDKDNGVFKIVDPPGLAKLWGIQKNHLSMNYDKMSRALRYYYRVNILKKVQGERHCYQFLRNPTELKSIKNISLLRQQMEAQAAAQKAAEEAAQAQAFQQAAQQAVQHHQQLQQQQQHFHRPSSSSPTDETLVTDQEEEPRDLTMGQKEKEAARRTREMLERERYLAEAKGDRKRAYQPSSPSPDREREDQPASNGARRPAFDFKPY